MHAIGPNAIFVLIEIALVLCFLVWLGWFRRRGPMPAMEEFQIGTGTREAEPTGPRIQWLGHSSFRLEWAGQVILLDPVLSDRVSVAPRRIERPSAACLAGADAILVTHGHMDHFNNETLAMVPPCELFLPRKAERFLNRAARKRHRLRTFRMGDSFALGSIRVNVVKARHGGWRYPWQLGYFACGFVLIGPDAVLYYAGDSAWGDHFAEIGEQFRPDIAILPIGGYSPRWFLRSRHINPPEAVRAVRQLGASRIIPCHYGAYRVSLEGLQAPIRWFRREFLTLKADSARTPDPRN